MARLQYSGHNIYQWFSMAVELVILGLVLALSIGSFLVGWLTDHKFFFVAAFLFLMFSGVLVQSAGGLIVGHYYNVEGVYSSSIITLADSSLFLFSQACFWIGLVLLAWLGLVSAFGSSKSTSPFSF